MGTQAHSQLPPNPVNANHQTGSRTSSQHTVSASQYPSIRNDIGNSNSTFTSTFSNLPPSGDAKANLMNNIALLLKQKGPSPSTTQPVYDRQQQLSPTQPLNNNHSYSSNLNNNNSYNPNMNQPYSNSYSNNNNNSYSSNSQAPYPSSNTYPPSNSNNTYSTSNAYNNNSNDNLYGKNYVTSLFSSNQSQNQHHKRY